MVSGVTENVVKLGLSLIAEEWELYDQILRDRKDLLPGWQIVRCDQVSKLTLLGEVTYYKTYFHNPKTGERCYCRFVKVIYWKALIVLLLVEVALIIAKIAKGLSILTSSEVNSYDDDCFYKQK